MISKFMVHARLTPDRWKCQFCLEVTDPAPNVTLYTRRYLVTMDTSISDFYTCFYITEKKPPFQLPHIYILVTHNCGNTRCDTLKHHVSLQ